MRKKLLLVAFAVWVSLSTAQARERFFAYCQRGGQKVITQGLQSSGLFQRTFQSCTLHVYLAGTTTLATIYSDNLSPATALANPFTAASDGYFEFYAAAGRYDVQETYHDTTVSPAVTIQLTWGDIILCDPVGPNIDTICAAGVGGTHNLLSPTHPDTVPFSPPQVGDLIRGSTSNLWERFSRGTASQLLVMDPSGSNLEAWHNFNFYQNSLVPVNATSRLGVNIIAGSGLTVTAADDPAHNRVTYTISSPVIEEATSFTNPGDFMTGEDASGKAICATPAPSPVSTSDLVMQENFCSSLVGTTSPGKVDSQLAWHFTMQAFSNSQLISFESSDTTSTITHPCNWYLDSGSGVNANTGGTLVMGITTTTSGRWVNVSKQTFTLVGIVANANAAAGRGVLRFGLMDSSNNFAPVNNGFANVFFSTTDGGGVADTNWTCNQTSFGGAGIDTVDSGVTATHYNGTTYVYRRLEIVANASATAVVWKIDGNPVCQAIPNTHYPNGTSTDFFIAPTFSAINPTGNAADTAQMLMDFFSMNMTLTR